MEYRGARDDGCNRPSRPWRLLQVYITRDSALSYLSPALRSTDGQRVNFARRMVLLDYPRSVPAVPLSCGLPISSGSAYSSPGQTVLRERHGERRGSLEANTSATGTARGTGFDGIHGEKGSATEEAIHRKHEVRLAHAVPKQQWDSRNGEAEPQPRVLLVTPPIASNAARCHSAGSTGLLCREEPDAGIPARPGLSEDEAFHLPTPTRTNFARSKWVFCRTDVAENSCLLLHFCCRTGV